jgi:hypothetical protein
LLPSSPVPLLACALLSLFLRPLPATTTVLAKEMSSSAIRQGVMRQDRIALCRQLRHRYPPLIYGDFATNILPICGKLGIGTKTPAYPIQTAGGAYCTGLKWIDVSSREYKDEIEALSTQEARDALAGLNPVKFVYKTDRTEQHLGFIAEDVPELVSTKDRKGLSSLEIVTVLIKVVQEQQGIIEAQQKSIAAISEKVSELERLLKSKGLSSMDIVKAD